MFVCIGNSCRSPMAKGFARARHADVIEAYSSGIGPASIIQPETYQAMREVGVSLGGQFPKYIPETPYPSMDLIINMSRVPLLPRLPYFEPRPLMPDGPIEQLVPDPIGLGLTTYRSVRDDIEQRASRLAEELRLELAA